MFARVRRFFQRNMGRIVFGVITVPLIYRMTRFAARHYLTYQRQRTHELAQKYKKQQMFEMMEEGFGRTFATWYEIMRETIREHLSADTYADQLKNGSGDKLENWIELKIVAFSSLLSHIYGSSMLTVLLRAQVNVISGILFKQLEHTPENLDILGRAGRAPEAEQSKRHMISDEIQQEYMSLTRYLCTDGVKSLCNLMHEKCRQIVGTLSLKQKMTVEDLEQLFTAIRNKDLRDDAEVSDWCPITESWHYMFSNDTKLQYLYPPQASSRSCWVNEREAFLRTLFGEAYDLVNAEDSRTILKFLETQGINFYLDRISDFINSVNQPGDNDLSHSMDSSFSSEHTLSNEEPSAALAKLIPVMNSFVSVPYNDDMWATLLLHNESLKNYSANIYESYSSKQFD